MKNQYFQYILDKMERFEFPPCLSADPDTLLFIRAGKYFSPFIQYNVLGKCSDVFKKLKLHPKANEPFPKESDLTPIVELLRLGGMYGVEVYI